MNNLRAALTLTFQDQLTPGLDKLKVGLEAINRIGKSLGLGELGTAAQTLRGATDGAHMLSRAIAAVGATADRVTSAIHRATQATRQWGAATFGPQSRIGAFGAVAGGYSLQFPLQGAGAQSELLRTSTITAGKYGPEADAFMKMLAQRYGGMSLATGQSSRSLADLGAWMLYNGYSPDTMAKVMPGTARVATAYGADVKDVARVGEALGFNLKIAPEQIDRALAILALLGKEGGFQFPDQSRVIPGVASAASLASMSGMGAVEELAAAMQIVLKGVPDRDPAAAGTQLQDLLFKMDAEPTRKAFKEYGVDIRETLAKASLEGQSALIAGLAKIQWVQEKVARDKRITDPKLRAISDDNVVKDLFGDKEAKAGASILLKNVAEFKRLIALAKGVDVGMVDRDFEERMRDDNIALTTLNENLTQTSNRLGTAFTPMVRKANEGFERMRQVMASVDARFPGLTDGAILATGVMIALGTALGVLGVVAPQVAAGFTMLWGVLSLLATPLGLTALVLAGTAWHIMSNWQTFQPFFAEMWTGVKGVFGGFTEFLLGVFTADMDRAIAGLKRMWEGYKSFYSGLFSTLKTLFSDLTTTLDGWTGGGVTTTFNVIASAIGVAAEKIEAFMKWFRELTGIGDESGQGGGILRPRHPRIQQPWNNVPIPQSFSPEEGAPGGSTTIYIRTEPGTTVTRIEGDTRGVSVDAGLVTGRA